MAPLVGYGSSDEEEDEVQPQDVPAKKPQEESKEPDIEPSEEKPVTEEEAHISPPPLPPQPQPNAEQPGPSSRIGPTLPSSSATMGPSLPPADEVEAYPEQMDEDLGQGAQADPGQPPSSPYSANRALLHQLTLPTVPNMDIPPSPTPGSPSSDARHAALTAKFDKFLELKRTKGVHFNARIAGSRAFRNPEQTDKLLGFIGIDTKFDRDSSSGTGQYATTLPSDLWDPAGFPAWAYRGQLRRAQEKVAKERARAQGEAVQFVPAADP